MRDSLHRRLFRWVQAAAAGVRGGSVDGRVFVVALAVRWKSFRIGRGFEVVQFVADYYDSGLVSGR